MPEDKTNAIRKEKEKTDPRIIKLSLILMVGAIAPLLDFTMANVAIKTIAVDLDTSVSVVQWVITGYMLAMGLAVPLSGWAVERFGGKKTYIFALALFLAGSLLASLSWNIGSLIVFRLVQGLGAGLLIPTLQTILVGLSKNRGLGYIISIISIPSLLAPILGPVIGGIIVELLNWRWIFYVNIPITIAGILLVWRIIPSDKPTEEKPRLDTRGLALLSPAIVFIIFAITQISQEGGPGSSRVLLPFLIGFALLAAFIVYAFKTKREPVLNLRMFKIKNYFGSNIMLFFSGMIMSGAMFILPLYYQQVRGESVLMTGLLMIPQGIGMLVTRSWIGRLADRIGPRVIVLVSLGVMIAGTLPFVFSGPGTSMILLAAAMVVIGAAQNGLWIPVTVSAYMGLNKHEVPNASMAIRIFQTIGSAFGAAILATIIGDDITRTAATTPQAIAGAFDIGFIGLIACCAIAFIPSFLLSTRKGVEQTDK